MLRPKLEFRRCGCAEKPSRSAEAVFPQKTASVRAVTVAEREVCETTLTGKCVLFQVGLKMPPTLSLQVVQLAAFGAHADAGAWLEHFTGDVNVG